MSQSTWLVTGGAGFIGANFVLKQIRQERVRIVNLDALTYAGNLDTLAPVMDDPAHVFIRGSITDPLLLKRVFAEYRPQAVVNFAAESHVDRSIDSPADFIHTNVVGTFQLLEAARGYWNELAEDERTRFRFLHVSTDEVYGSLGSQGQFSELSPYRPNSPYSASKAGSDHLVRAYHHTYGLPTLTTNCSNNYGPYQFPEKLIPLTILNALDGKSLPVYGQGLNVRDWLYVEDHCSAIERVLEAGHPGEVYNIGGNNEKTNIEVVRTICRILDRLRPQAGGTCHERLITFVEDRPGHDLRYAIDASKIRRELGWEPRENFQTGIEKTVRWYLDHLDWCRRVTDGSYRRERLGVAV